MTKDKMNGLGKSLKNLEDIVLEKELDKEQILKEYVSKMSFLEVFSLRNNMIRTLSNTLRENSRKGVEQGGLIRDEQGNVVGRYGRRSKNELWYRNLYHTLGRCPNNLELRKEAIRQLREGVQTEWGYCPKDELFMALEEQLDFYINGKKEKSVIEKEESTIKELPLEMII